MGQQNVQEVVKTGLQNKLMDFEAIAYNNTNALVFTDGLPNYNKMIIEVDNNTNETLTLTLAGGVTGQAYEFNYIDNNNTISQLPAMSIGAGNSNTFVGFPLAVKNELLPSFATAPTSGSYTIKIYLYLE